MCELITSTNINTGISAICTTDVHIQSMAICKACDKITTTRHFSYSLKGKSCLINLVAFYNEGAVLVDKGRVTDIIYLDLCKTFDIVQHDTLGDIDLTDGPLDG